MSFHPARPSSVLASVLAAAAITLTTAGCSHITPLGPDSTAGTTSRHTVAGPVPVLQLRHLSSPIILQVMRNEPVTAAGGCPAGSVAVTVPPGAASGGCYRPVGTPVTITSAGVSSVSALPQPPPPPGQAAGPKQYGFSVNPAKVAAVTALIKKAYDSRDSVGVSAAGKLWEAPKVLQPFSGQQLQVAFASKSQALRLYRTLLDG